MVLSSPCLLQSLYTTFAPPYVLSIPVDPSGFFVWLRGLLVGWPVWSSSKLDLRNARHYYRVLISFTGTLYFDGTPGSEAYASNTSVENFWRIDIGVRIGVCNPPTKHFFISLSTFQTYADYSCISSTYPTSAVSGVGPLYIVQLIFSETFCI
jgi:hypothetical protein